MTNIYFKMLIEIQKTSKIIEELINRYIKTRNVNCTSIQMTILHVIMLWDGTAFPSDFDDYLDGVITNTAYSIGSLLKNGYLSCKDGREIGVDPRRTCYFITEKGKKLCNDVDSYLEKRLAAISKRLKWYDEDFENYFDELYKIQRAMSKV